MGLNGDIRMTCIVAVECVDGAVVGGDFLASNSFNKSVTTRSKIYQRDSLIMGFCGSFRMGQIIEAAIKKREFFIPKEDEDIYTWLITDFISFLRTELRAGLGNAVFDKASIDWDISFLVSIHGQIWEINGDFGVLGDVNGVISIGSGLYHAGSSLHTQIEMLGRRPTIVEAKKFIALAYKVTSNHIASVSSEFSVLEYKKPTPEVETKVGESTAAAAIVDSSKTKQKKKKK